MKSRPRIRKFVKWGGAIAAFLFILLTVAGKWNYLYWYSDHGDQIWFGRGYFCVVTGGPRKESGWHVGRLRYDKQILLGFSLDVTGEGIVLKIPLWFPALICGAASGVAWNHDRRALKRLRAGCCTKCGYDRTGIAAESACPECSTAASVSSH